jgi:cytosine-specific methyltransferase
MINNNLTYISLFSSAGVGCFGFKQEGFECVATNEIIDRRLEIQKINKKCKFDSGYISGDIQKIEIKDRISVEIKKWEKLGNDNIDVIIATPPCQGMSVANHKKNNGDLQRNSLIVQSVDLVNDINPRFFIFENVAAFWKTGCTLKDGTIMPIGEMIERKLSNNFLISKRIINFKNYGSNSSRTRTLIIGVRKDLSDFVVPIELYPDYVKEKPLFDVIGDMKSLNWGEYDTKDFFHSFREYPKRMRKWISDLKPGESAFDNDDPGKIPHRAINGEILFNKAKIADKYTRQEYAKVAPCIHTRNDQLASQNTIHPIDDRVFSIRELMKMMTIPSEFKWTYESIEELNSLSVEDKKKLSKKIEMNIRQSIGEAVPTSIFRQIAKKIKKNISKKILNDKDILKVIENKKLEEISNLTNFVKANKNLYTESTILRIIEMANTKRQTHSAFYTNRFIVNHIIEDLPEFEKDEITIVEPSVGAGNFLKLLYKKYESKKRVNLILIDIDEDILRILESLNQIPDNFNVNYICDNFLNYDFREQNVDLVIGNPPFSKISGKNSKKYLDKNYNKCTRNIAEMFLEKAMSNSDYVSLILPKNILNTPEFIDTRKLLKEKTIDYIHDFGEIGFKGVLVETVNLMVDTKSKRKSIIVKSITDSLVYKQKLSYISDEKLPYWVIYRNESFDNIYENMKFNIFDVFRDRQITTQNSTLENMRDCEDYVRVLKARNISDDGQEIVNIDTYDSYISLKELDRLSVKKFIDREDIYMTPNMTYKPRVAKKEKGYVVNGSIALLIPKNNEYLNDEQMRYFSTNEYREFYKIARNKQTRSLNIDKTSVFWFGRKK